MAKYLVLLVAAVFVGSCLSETLQVGTSVNGTLAYVEEVKLSSVPFTVRTKNVFFSDEKQPNLVIKGISAIDILNSTASVKITAGGVGSSFTNIRLKSGRGDGLHYQVQIFV